MSKISMHDTAVRAVVPLVDLGDVLICGLPGLVIAQDGQTYLDPEHADLTYDFLKSHGVVRLYLLMEDLELPPATKSVLEKAAKFKGIALEWMPIVDYGRPDQAFEDVWTPDRSGRADILENQGSIAVACLYGAGRSGMMAAAISAECGIEPRKAVRYVRKFYSEAVGSKTQEDWVAAGKYLIDDL